VVRATVLAVLFFVVTFLVVSGEVSLAHIGITLPHHAEAPLTLFFLSLFALVLWMRFFALWSDHWLDVWIITSERVIDIEQMGFFKRSVASFPLDRIQDVTHIVHGFIPTLFHYGDVKIQTASITQHLIMAQVPYPDRVKQILTEASERVRIRERKEGGGVQEVY
jgi:membrane protein YdbS with pleckstrin-like domain